MATATVPESKLIDPQPATEPEGRYEVVDGQVREKPPMGNFENFLASDLLTLLNSFVQSNRLGWVVMEPLFRLKPEINLQRRPDLAFISFDRWPLKRGRPRDTPWDVVPDLAVEVVSPTNQHRRDHAEDRGVFPCRRQTSVGHLPSVEKIHVYHSPKEIQVLGRGDTLEGGSVVPGFQVDLNDLFGNDWSDRPQERPT